MVESETNNQTKSTTCHVIVWNRFIPFSRFHGGCCWSQSQLSLGEGRVLPGHVASSSQQTDRIFVKYLEWKEQWGELIRALAATAAATIHMHK